jgi:hypothetical protein
MPMEIAQEVKNHGTAVIISTEVSMITVLASSIVIVKRVNDHCAVANDQCGSVQYHSATVRLSMITVQMSNITV